MPQYFYKEQYIMLYIWRWWHYLGDLQLESSKTKTNRIGDTIYNLAYIVLQYSDRKCYERTSKIHLYPILQIDAYLVLDQLISRNYPDPNQWWAETFYKIDCGHGSSVQLFGMIQILDRFVWLSATKRRLKLFQITWRLDHGQPLQGVQNPNILV